MSILDFRILGIKNWSMTGKKMYIDIWKKRSRIIHSNFVKRIRIAWNLLTFLYRSIYPEIRSR